MSILFTESLPGSEEGSSGKQIMPQLLNKAFQENSDNAPVKNARKNPKILHLSHANKV